MNWFDKILERKNTPDDSRELKKGEVKGLLTNSFKTFLPDFDFAAYKNSTYYFQRIRTFRGLTLYETINIIFGLKDKVFSCSIASTLNKSYLFSSSYNNGFLVGHADLLVIKSGSGSSKIEDAYYWHNGKISTIEKVIHQITMDIKKYGLDYLDRRLKTLETHDLVRYGIDFIQKLTENKKTLKSEMERKNSEYIVSRIKHPLFIKLRDGLQNIPNQTRDDRQKISGLTFELMEYYYENE